MPSDFSYKSYVTDDAFLAGYNEYQKKYAKEIRESDKVVLALTRETHVKQQILNPLEANGRLTVIRAHDGRRKGTFPGGTVIRFF